MDPATSASDRGEALAVINNWRSSHSYPLNTLQVNLRRAARVRDAEPTIAQRIKRLPSIRHKLERIPGMKLARMHDLGGARAVLSSVDAVESVVAYYLHESEIKHRLVRHDPYIAEPQESGYRGVHLVYAYYSDKEAKEAYNDLRIELQIRTRLQHAWATAVETVGTFTAQALKSSQGAADWLRFFALMSSALALREGTAPVPETPEDPKLLVAELQEYVVRLDVLGRLRAFNHAVQIVEERSEELTGSTFLLELNSEAGTLSIASFDDRAAAAEHYDSVEREIEGDPVRDAVLVTVESIASLRQAYPNYFADTTVFLEAVEEAIA